MCCELWIFFFKQKTAYEMRISDWSSDVCSSDLRRERVDVIHAHWLLPQGWVAAMLRFLPGPKVPFVVTSHGADLYALKGNLLDAIKRFVVCRASAVTALDRKSVV